MVAYGGGHGRSPDSGENAKKWSKGASCYAEVSISREDEPWGEEGSEGAIMTFLGLFRLFLLDIKGVLKYLGDVDGIVTFFLRFLPFANILLV